jgi:hypothetical protein
MHEFFMHQQPGRSLEAHDSPTNEDHLRAGGDGLATNLMKDVIESGSPASSEAPPQEYFSVRRRPGNYGGRVARDLPHYARQARAH